MIVLFKKLYVLIYKSKSSKIIKTFKTQWNINEKWWWLEKNEIKKIIILMKWMAFLFCSPAHLVKRYAAKVLV